MQRGLALLTFGAIYLVLLKSLHWKLILTQTTAAGGDMGSHHYVATFLREELLPRGRVSGWAPGWFAGIPMLTFYFPLPYVLIAALTLPLGDQVAFKLVTVLGLLLLPVTCWAAFRLLRLREPAPLLAACAATVFLFMNQVTPTEQFTIWGGNIASTMAGEFPFSISFALLPLALAVLWRVCEDGKGWRAAALLVSAVVLSHILTTIVLVLGVAVLVVRRPLAAALASFRRLALVMGVAFCLTAFWGLPFILRVQYTAHFRWTPARRLQPAAPQRDPALSPADPGRAGGGGGQGGAAGAAVRLAGRGGRVRVRRPHPGRARGGAVERPHAPLPVPVLAAGGRLRRLGGGRVGGRVAAAAGPGCRCATPGWPWSR